MDLYVVRHAIAEQRDSSRWPDDSQRPLSDRGRSRFQAVAELLGRVVPEADAVLSSRYVRAWQTAELLAEHAGWPEPTPCPELEGAASATVCEALQQFPAETVVAIVGHEPSFSELVAYFLTGDEGGMEMEFKKGGAACLRFPAAPRPGSASLCWYLTARLAGATQEA
ncbi:MAG: histidine phosphatase family protein [Phycisphaerales bacterium]|nr:MAG: histidine phosphatase family protein [Phycisphaerales bacterium]